MPNAGEEIPRRVIRIERARCRFAQLPCISAGLRARLTALYGVVRRTDDRKLHIEHAEDCPVRLFGMFATCMCEPDVVLCGRRS